MENENTLYPIVHTDRFAQCRAFYRDRMAVELTADIEGRYFSVRFGGPEGPVLGFTPPNAMDGQAEAFRGGLTVSIPAGDADRAEAELRRKGVEIASPSSDKPWGWRSFLVRDPAGVELDFFHVLPQSE